MTLELYHQHVRPFLHNAPAVDSIEELNVALLDTFRNEW